MQICELMSPNYEIFPCYYYKGCSSSVHQPANLLKVMAAGASSFLLDKGSTHVIRASDKIARPKDEVRSEEILYSGTKIC